MTEPHHIRNMKLNYSESSFHQFVTKIFYKENLFLLRTLLNALLDLQRSRMGITSRIFNRSLFIDLNESKKKDCNRIIHKK